MGKKKKRWARAAKTGATQAWVELGESAAKERTEEEAAEGRGAGRTQENRPLPQMCSASVSTDGHAFLGEEGDPGEGTDEKGLQRRRARGEGGRGEERALLIIVDDLRWFCALASPDRCCDRSWPFCCAATRQRYHRRSDARSALHRPASDRRKIGSQPGLTCLLLTQPVAGGRGEVLHPSDQIVYDILGIVGHPARV